MKSGKKVLFVLCAVMIVVIMLSACGTKGKEVVIYTSVDQIFAEDILKEFEEETGIKVKPVFDVEATKTVGLANRVIAEKNKPQADVFWSGEFIMTIVLANEGVLTPYASPSAVDIPAIYKDPDNLWTGYAGRARVIFVNTDLLSPEEYPTSIYDFLDPDRDPSRMAIAQPMFGTTMTQAAALYAYLGEQEARDFFEQIKARGVRVVDGNSVTRDMVAAGQVAFALTDTDDACISVNKGDPVKVIIPDQDDMGTLVIPNTIAMVKGGPNPEEAKVLIDYLLSKEMEKKLIERGWSHIPVRPIDVETACIPKGEIKNMSVTFEEIFNYRDMVNQQMAEIFVK